MLKSTLIAAGVLAAAALPALAGDHGRVRTVRTVVVRRTRVVHRRFHYRYVPGHYEIREERVWIPETWREETVPAVYREVRDYYGRVYRILVKPAEIRRIRIPGRYEIRRTRVWIPPTWIRVRRGPPRRVLVTCR